MNADSQHQLDRDEQIRQLAERPFDVLVIGGGATGAGCALDAATRGLSVALVERHDFSEGTSSRSTKLIHGGVRYLEQAVRRLDYGQYRLVREALAERATLLRLAPHLSRSLALITPLYRRWHVPYFLTGLKIYDWVAGAANIAPSRYLSAAGTLERFPRLRRTRLRGSVMYHDGQFDDARMNIAIVLTAHEHGAVIANHLEVTGLLREGDRLSGANVRDRLTDATFGIRARSVINATGPFTDSIRRMDDPHCRSMMTVSSGVHIVLDGRFVPPETGLLVPKTEDGRVLFLLPWLGHTLVGTTDNAATLEEHPRAGEAEIDYLIRHVRQYFDLPIDREDVKAAWSGLRPLVAEPDASGTGTARISRDHVVTVSRSGLVTITGGKWTTYRRMAVDAVNEAVSASGLPDAGPSRTASIHLAGGQGYHRELAEEVFAAHDEIDPATAAHLVHAYGDRASSVAALTDRDPGLAHRLAPDHVPIEAEIVHAIEREMAVTAMDALARRVRLAFLDSHAAEHALPQVIDLMAERLGWDAARRSRELTDALERLHHAL